MTATAIEPIGAFCAEIRPSGSKSLTNRALLLAALAQGQSTLTDVLISDDTRVMLEALGELGFQLNVDETAKRVEVMGQGGAIPRTNAELTLGNAGTAYRFLLAACCLGEGAYRLDGVARMRERPVAQLVEALHQIGGQTRYENTPGFPPVSVHGGELVGGEITMPPTLSSQYISALLQVAPFCKKGLTIRFDGAVTSRPYVAMTLGLMRRFGVTAQVDDKFERICIEPSRYRATDYAVEPDASNASYFLTAAAITPGASCTIEGLGKQSLQGDVGFADVLHQMGADLLFGPDFITIKAPPDGESLRGVDVDFNDMPDMAQTLAAGALFAKGRTTIRNVGNLRIKETDRLAALETELTKLGAMVKIQDDDLLIDPPPADANGRVQFQRAHIDTYDDHRMAMSFAVIGLGAGAPDGASMVTINDPDCVNKTFPDFFEYLDVLRTSSTDSLNQTRP